jgi:hypothetical protein
MRLVRRLLGIQSPAEKGTLMTAEQRIVHDWMRLIQAE